MSINGKYITRRSFVKASAAAGAAALLGGSAFSLVGCSSGDGGGEAAPEQSGGESGGMRTKVKLGYWSATECDASLLAAYLAGYYEEEGLEPELVLVDYNTWPAQVANGQVDQMMVSGDSFNPMA